MRVEQVVAGHTEAVVAQTGLGDIHATGTEHFLLCRRQRMPSTKTGFWQG